LNNSSPGETERLKLKTKKKVGFAMETSKGTTTSQDFGGGID
jgi:hypothetical protein